MGILESFNPATGELVGTVDTITPGDVDAVVAEVAEVQPFWAELSIGDRARYLRRAADVMVDEVDEIAQLLTAEQGKPITESYTRGVARRTAVGGWCAKTARRIRAEEPLSMSQPLF